MLHQPELGAFGELSHLSFPVELRGPIRAGAQVPQAML